MLVSMLSSLRAQPITDHKFLSPLKIPLVLAGNFGEIRGNHFHSGLDFKTNGASGHAVHASASGFIARIKVEPGGYGKALYVQHPNGYTTLYGHLSSFRKDIAEYVKEIQYQKERFSVDLYLSPQQFKLNAGDFIALSGNTGSSQAPHLHFEIRESANQHPVNPLLYPFTVNDNRPPQIKNILLYSLEGRYDLKRPYVVEVSGSNGRYRSKSNVSFPVDQIAGIGIEAIDYLDDSSNKCGVYSIDLQVDGQTIFQSRLDEFSFSESRYINTLIDYRLYTESRQQVIKTYLDPNNPLSIYDFIKNQGKIVLTDHEDHLVSIQITDVHGNQSNIEFLIHLSPDSYQPYELDLPFYSAYFSYQENHRFEDQGITLDFSSRSFYDNIYFRYQQEPMQPGTYTPLHRIHDEGVPVHRSYRLALQPTGLPEEFEPFALIVKLDSANGPVPVGGNWEGELLVTQTRNFGNYTIMLDSIAPSIRFQGQSNAEGIKVGSKISFKIDDDFSGISSYRGTLDGQWILFEWDPKTNRLFHKTDSRLLPKNVAKQLRLTVIDRVGNRSIFTQMIKR